MCVAAPVDATVDCFSMGTGAPAVHLAGGTTGVSASLEASVKIGPASRATVPPDPPTEELPPDPPEPATAIPPAALVVLLPLPEPFEPAAPPLLLSGAVLSPLQEAARRT